MYAPNTARDDELLQGVVSRLARSSAFPLVFGGLVSHSGIHVTALAGHRTMSLRDLHVVADRGLGGRALSELRPRIAVDYRTSSAITHDYDRQVLMEGVRTLLAVPVLVDGVVRSVLYAGRRSDESTGGVAVGPVVRAAQELGREFAARDATVRRSAGGVLPAGRPDGLDSMQLEELRSSFAELRSISSSVTDPELLDRLRHLEGRLAALAGAGAAGEAGGVGADAPDAEPVLLAPRETDVLGYVALGRTNRETAAALGLAESTVKSYLGTAMQKLGATTRHDAVVRARRRGLLP